MSAAEVTGSLAGRTVYATLPGIALAELLDGESETVDELGDQTFAVDPDERPIPFQITTFRAALIDTATGELLGRMTWRPIPYALRLSCTSWNIGIQLLPTALGRRVSVDAGLLLARHLFATTGVDRVQAFTDVENVPGWRGLERAGFHREGVLRGATLRGGRRRDMVVYSLLRADVELTGGEREVLARRDQVVLARPLPEEHREVKRLAGGERGPDADQRLSPAAPAAHRASVLDAMTGRLLGGVSWRAVDHGGTFGSAAWNVGVEVVPEARGRGVGSTSQRLLVEHLFATTEFDRVEAGVDVEATAARRALESVGFRLDGVLRGAGTRGGKHRDLALYGLLRGDLDGH
jgi:RimJ/RimL family protein N-acetyltransferase